MRKPATNRRGFLQASSLSLAATPFLMGAAHAGSIPPLPNSQQENDSVNTKYRIREMTLRTAVDLKKMGEYYKNVLEMDIRLSEGKLIVQGGATQINFIPAENGTHPFYHFAFNIPENKILSARKWLGERTQLSVTPAGKRESGMPNDVMPFNHWNSHSLFFWDPAGNILELICRHDLNNGTKGEFRSDEIFYASEIGFVSEDVNSLADNIKSTFHLSQYRGGGSTFRAIGDETGLLILFKRGGVPIGAKEGQSWQIHPTDVTVRPDMKFTSKSDPHSFTAG